MTVPLQNPFSTYTGNGVTTNFAYTFKLATSADLRVLVEGVLQTTGYNVTNAGNDSGGSIVFTVAPAAGARIVFARDVVLQRLTDYQYAGDFLSPTVNLDFDRLWMALQDQSRLYSRAIKIPLDENTVTTLPSAVNRAGRFLAFDSEGNVTTSFGPELQGLAVLLADRASAAKGSALIGYKRPSVGSLGRTLSDKLGEILSVKDFGAKGDGTTDDTAAIRAAVAVSAGKTLLFPPGDYKVVDGFILNGDNTHIVGYGARILYSQISVGSYFHCIAMSGNHISVRGLSIIGPVGAIRNSTGFGMSFGGLTDTQDVTVEDCLFDGIGSAGAWFTNVVNSKFINNTIQNCHADGVHWSDGCFEIVCTGNRVKDCDDDHIAIVNDQVETPARLVGVSVISGNIILGSAGKWGNGIALIGAQSTLVTGNQIDGLTGAGIASYSYVDPDPANYTDFLVIEGNHITNCGRPTTATEFHPDSIFIGVGVYLEGVKKATVKGNTISNLGYQEGKVCGAIRVAAVGVAVVTDNHIYDTLCDGVYSTVATEALSICRNDFGYIGRTSIRVAGTAAICTVSNNTFYVGGATSDIDINLPSTPVNCDYSGSRPTSVISLNRGSAVKANFNAYSPFGQAVHVGSYAKLFTGTERHDLSGSFEPSGSVFTVPNTGQYVFSGGMVVNNSANNNIYLALFVNGNPYVVLAGPASPSAVIGGSYSGTTQPIQLVKGDQIWLSASSSITANTMPDSTYFGGYQL